MDPPEWGRPWEGSLGSIPGGGFKKNGFSFPPKKYRKEEPEEKSQGREKPWPALEVGKPRGVVTVSVAISHMRGEER